MSDLQEQGSPSQPIHLSLRTPEQADREIDDYIRSKQSVEGNWQTYISEATGRITIPEKLREIYANGGVITRGLRHHLSLFTSLQWSRYQKILSKRNGINPVNDDLSRHIYESMHRFPSLDNDGTLVIPKSLREYARLKDDVAIVGLVYMAEIHDLDDYSKSQQIKAVYDRANNF